MSNIGKELKERGQALALAHAGMSWKEHAMWLLDQFCRHGPGASGEFAMEDYRAWALSNGLDNPPSPNAWGSLPQHGIREGIMKPTGKYRPARSPMTRGHPVRTYRSLAAASKPAAPSRQIALFGEGLV